MIVLAISGLMFIVAVNFINGKQEHTAFSTGSNDFVSQLQSVVQDVTDGHYSDIPIGCTSPAPGSISFSGPTSSQGTNASCIFMGKLVSFSNIGSPSADQYTTYSLAAARSISGTLPQASVAVIPNLTTQGVTSQSLYVKAMHVYDESGTTPVSPPSTQTIGFAQGFGNLALGAPGVYQSGAQSVSLIYSTDPSSIGGINVVPAQSAVICLTDGTRYADILIGGSDASGQSSSSNNNNQLSITARQLETTPCS